MMIGAAAAIAAIAAAAGEVRFAKAQPVWPILRGQTPPDARKRGA